MQVIKQASTEAAKTAVMTVKEAENSINPARSVQIMFWTGDPKLKPPILCLKAAYKYQELQNFEIEVKYIFTIKSCSTQDNERVPTILNFLSREDTTSKYYIKQGLNYSLQIGCMEINHGANRDEEILVMCISINIIESCTDILDCITAEEIRGWIPRNFPHTVWLAVHRNWGT